ncbi:hypothetical protein ACFRR7_05670 [Streptomyces sp. NPDC056909]
MQTLYRGVLIVGWMPYPRQGSVLHRRSRPDLFEYDVVRPEVPAHD